MSDPRPSSTDVLIVGAGIAGASVAAALAPHRRVLTVEAEEAPGYHATGRSMRWRGRQPIFPTSLS
jgi:D-arginine dehydrogenase